jgi:hypothetical protein
LVEQLANRGCEVQPLGEAHQFDAKALEIFHQPHQVNQAAPKTVEFPDQDDREHPSLRIRQQAV